jgi:hypothetical protein
MDEVDFTILAATSVLGDLIEKCPPAEACRDAFDRMSKATVQMCMSTTGFGASSSLSTRRRSHSQSNQQHHNQSTETDYFSKQYRRESRGPQNSSRPKPQFDMGLNDLLGSPPNTNSTMQTPQPPPFRPNSQNSMGAPSSNTSGGVKMEFESYNTSATPAITGPIRQNTSNSNSQTLGNSPSDYAMSPPLSALDTSAIDPSLLPSPQSAFQTTSSNYNQNQTLYGGGDMQFPFQIAPGMDFLQGGWVGSGFDGGWNGDLGMGMGTGWDGGAGGGDHGDGGGVDLFDGFFFGGTGGF